MTQFRLNCCMWVVLTKEIQDIFKNKMEKTEWINEVNDSNLTSKKSNSSTDGCNWFVFFHERKREKESKKGNEIQSLSSETDQDSSEQQWHSNSLVFLFPFHFVHCIFNFFLFLLRSAAINAHLIIFLTVYYSTPDLRITWNCELNLYACAVCSA